MGLFSFSSLSPINFLLTKKEKIITPKVKTFQDVPFGNLTKAKDSNVSYIGDTKSYDYGVTNYYSTAQDDAIITIQTKKEQNVNPNVDQTTIEEKPVNIAPSLLGSGGSTSTGGGNIESSGTPILTYALIGAGLLAGVYMLKRK